MDTRHAAARFGFWAALATAALTTLSGSFAASLAALAVVSVAVGPDPQDTFEIVVISIVWLTLVVGGPLMAVVFRRAALQEADSQPARAPGSPHPVAGIS